MSMCLVCVCVCVSSTLGTTGVDCITLYTHARQRSEVLNMCPAVHCIDFNTYTYTVVHNVDIIFQSEWEGG